MKKKILEDMILVNLFEDSKNILVDIWFGEVYDIIFVTQYFERRNQMKSTITVNIITHYNINATTYFPLNSISILSFPQAVKAAWYRPPLDFRLHRNFNCTFSLYWRSFAVTICQDLHEIIWSSISQRTKTPVQT